MIDSIDDIISFRDRQRLTQAFMFIFLAAILFAVLFPIYWAFITSIRPKSELLEVPVRLFPRNVILDNYYAVFFDSDFFKYYFNSLIVSLGVVVLTTTTATLGGYGLTRIEFPFKKTFARGILFGYMFPPILLAIPMFILWREIGWINTYIGLILAITALALPFSLWMMWQYFQTVPISWEESAQIYGAPRFQAFYQIALPNAKPGIIAIAIFSYAVAWNQYTIPKILAPDTDMWVLTVGVDSYTQGFEIFWGQIMAASVMILIPAILLIYGFQTYLLEGFRTLE